MKRIVANLIVMACVFAIVMLCLEAAVRLKGRLYAPDIVRKHAVVDLMEYHPQLGWFHKKNLQAWIESQEYATPVSINSKGLRGNEYDYEKKTGVTRIVCLGDSFMFGLGVNDGEVCTARLEALFKANQEPYEVVNMAVNGYGTAQEFLLLHEEGMRYSPDIVICQFYAGNDLQNNIEAFEYGRFRPYFDHSDGRLVLKNQPVPEVEPAGSSAAGETASRRLLPFSPVKHFLQRKSYLYVFLRLRYNYLLYRLGIKKDIPEDTLKRGLDVTQAIIQRMAGYCAGRNIRFVMLLVPTKEQALGTGSSVVIETLKDYCKAHGVASIDLSPYFRARKDFNFTVDSHWNEAGHGFVAQILYDYLKDVK